MPKPKKISLNSFLQDEKKKEKVVEKSGTEFRLHGHLMTVEIFVKVYSFLSHHEAKNAAFVSRFFYAVGNSQVLWKDLFVRKVKLVWEGEKWESFFTEKDKKIRFRNLMKLLNKDEYFCCIKDGHVDALNKPERINNLSFSLRGTETIPGCLLFSTASSPQGSSSLKVWSVGSLSQTPHPLGKAPFDLLQRGQSVGMEGLHNPANHVVRQLASRDVGESVTKMFPVYTYFKEDDNGVMENGTWEYACVAGDAKGQVSFYTGQCSTSATESPIAASPIFQTDGPVVGLKCLIEERGFSGFKQAFGCGENDSGHLYDLQTNEMLANFPHEEGLKTETMDVSTDGHRFVLGQSHRKNGQALGIVRLFDMSPSGPVLSFSQVMGAPRCLQFANSDSGDLFCCTNREGIWMYDRRFDKAALKFATNNGPPLDQFCVVSARSLIAAACGPDVLLWDIRGSRPIRRFPHGHTPGLSSITCDSKPGTGTAGVIITGGFDGSIRLWHVSQLWQLRNSTEDVRRGWHPTPRREVQGRGVPIRNSGNPGIQKPQGQEGVQVVQGAQNGVEGGFGRGAYRPRGPSWRDAEGNEGSPIGRGPPPSRFRGPPRGFHGPNGRGASPSQMQNHHHHHHHFGMRGPHYNGPPPGQPQHNGYPPSPNAYPAPPPYGFQGPYSPYFPIGTQSPQSNPADSPSLPPSGAPRSLCPFFHQGTCRYDNHCAYRHVTADCVEYPTFPPPPGFQLEPPIDPVSAPANEETPPDPAPATG